MGADSYTYRKWSNVYEYYFKDVCGDVVYAMNQIVGRIGQYGYTAWDEDSTETGYAIAANNITTKAAWHV